MTEQRIRLKYLASLNDEALGEDTDPDYEMEYVDIGNVDSSGQIHEVVTYRFADAPSRARRRVRDGDVIVSCVRTYLQAIAPIEKPVDNLIVSTGFAVVRPRLGLLRAGFCKYALREPHFLAEVERRSVGVSYPAINSSELGAISLPAPPESVQRSVERFLDQETGRLDRLIAAKKRVLDLLAEKRKAIIATAVTRGIDSKVKMRDSGVSWLGAIPAHWKLKRAKWLFSERDERSTNGEETLLSLRMDRGLIPHNEVSPKQTRPEELVGYKRAFIGEIVVNRMRASMGLISVTPQDGLVSPDYAVFVPSPEASAHYYEHLFRTDVMGSIFRSESTGLGTGSSGFLRLYSENLLALWLPNPSIEEQRTIVEHISSKTTKLDNIRRATERTIALLKERRVALIAAAVTGKIDVGAVA